MIRLRALRVRPSIPALLLALGAIAGCGGDDDDGPTGPGGAGDGGTFVAAGSFGLPMVSPDGVDWTLASGNVPQSRHWSLATDGVDVVTSGPNETILGGQIIFYSDFPEGRNAVDAPFLRVLTHGAGRYVGIDDSRRVYTATDGLTFVLAQELELLVLAYEIEFGGGVFVAVGTSGVGDEPDVVHRSVDGLQWTPIAVPGITGNDARMFDVTYGDGAFRIVGRDDDDANSLWSSTDGLTWERRAMGLDGTAVPFIVAAGDGAVVALSSGDGEPSVYRWVSTDAGQSWSTAPAFTQNGMADMEFGSGRFVAVSSNGIVAVSTDGGLNWSVGNPNNGALRDIAYRP